MLKASDCTLLRIHFLSLTNMKAKATLISLLALTAALFSGCTTPVAVDPATGEQQTAEYRTGFFYASVDADADAVFQTAIRAIDNMGYLRTGELHKDVGITIYARKVGDEKVKVRIRQIAPGKSELRIRVGKLGNLPESQMIFAKIRNAM